MHYSLKNSKEFSKLHNDLDQKVLRKKRICVYPGCSNIAIGSHNISKAILSTIAHKGHVRMFKVVPYKGFGLPSVGINKATRFSGFCSDHDSQLFQPIDLPEANIDDEKNLLLLNYRATVQEQLLKTYKTEFYSLALHTFGNPNEYPFSYYRRRVHEIKMNLHICQWYGDRILGSLEGSSNEFVFKKIELPFYEVAASELFGFEPTFFSSMKRKVFDRFGFLQPFVTLFVHILPDTRKRNSFIIISTHKKDEEVLNWFFEHLSAQGPQKALSDLLLLYLELWCCSEQFYLTYIQPKKEEVKAMFARTADQNTTERETEIRLINS